MFMMKPLPADPSTDQDSGEILLKLANLSLDPTSPPVHVPFTAADLQLWKEFKEYKNNRQEWEVWRRDDWKKNHPPHISKLFDDFPVLETPRLRLRLLQQTDVEDVFRVCSDEATMKYYGARPHETINYTQKQYIDVTLSRFRLRDAIPLVITLKDDDKYIGHVSALQFDKVFKFVEICYILDREHWGKGIMSEAVKYVVDFIINKVKIHKIRAACFAKNIASKRVLEKVGFKQEGYLRDNVIIDGEYEDEYVMAFIASNTDITK
jgi:[ribosomal protein S5]-alanine N-acetyltransferase